MSAAKITDLIEVTGVDVSSDYLVIVDVSDTTMAGSGSTKKVKPYNLPISSGTQTSLDTKVTGISSSTSGRFPLFDGTSGKLLKEYTDTGIVKVTSGVPSAVTAPTGLIVGDSDSQTLSYKRVNPRVTEITSATGITPDISTTDDYIVTALATGITVNAPIGTPLQGQPLIIRFTDDGTSRSITWNSIYKARGVTLPTYTMASGTIYVGQKYNSTSTFWDVLAVASGLN